MYMGALNILLVDDDQNLATTLSYGILKAMGKVVSVAVCLNGSEALSLLETQRFDVVISDLNMPGASGRELLNQVKQLYRETLLILITAYGTETLEAEMHQLGNGYITKPFEPPRLVQMIHDLLRRKSQNIGQEDAVSLSDRLSNAI
jgi:CheY-like chemotaxis protein